MPSNMLWFLCWHKKVLLLSFINNVSHQEVKSHNKKILKERSSFSQFVLQFMWVFLIWYLLNLNVYTYALSIKIIEWMRKFHDHRDALEITSSTPRIFCQNYSMQFHVNDSQRSDSFNRQSALSGKTASLVILWINPGRQIQQNP